MVNIDQFLKVPRKYHKSESAAEDESAAQKTSLLLRQNLPQLPKVKLKQLRRVFSRENNQTLLYMGKGQTGQDVYTITLVNGKLYKVGKKKNMLISLFPAFRKFPALRNDENTQEHSMKLLTR